MPYIGTKPENIIATAVDTTTGKFSGEVDAASLDISGDVDVDGILEADAITLNGTAIGSIYSPIAGGTGILTTGALNSGSITSGFGAIDNGASAISTTGAISGGTLTGTLQTAAQTNITSVGTLTSFRSTGIDDNADALAITIDSSENVGIGVSSPQELLHLKDGNIAVGNGTASNNAVIGRVGFSTDSSNSRFIGIESFRGSDAANADLRFHTFGGDSNSGERMRIDTSGNVGIGISNPSSYDDGADKLVVGDSSGRSGITIVSSTSNDGSINFADGTSGTASYMGFINYHHNTNTMKLATNAGTRLTIDSNGNVLVGKTSNSHSTVGVGLESSGGGNFVVNGGTTLILNRLSSDGTILDLRKDSSSIGIIGTQGGRLSIGSGDVNLNFNASANAMYPISNPTAGTLSNGAVDIGAALARFKDLYLSGGVVFDAVSGNATSNTLDDYEEGTCSIGIGSGSSRSGTWSSAIGRYTKVGQKVTLQIDITGSGMYFSSTSGYAVISGVPFYASQGTGTQNYAGCWSGNNVGVASGGTTYLNATSLYLHASNSGQSSSGVSGIGVTITYFTAA